MNKSFKRTIAAISMTAMLAAGFAMPVSAATQVEVTGNPVMIRADAGLKNTVVSKAHKGDKYVYVGQKKDSTGRVWYNIKYSGNKTGWITSQFAKKTEDSAAEQPVSAAKQVQVTATPVNVRSGAGTNYKKLGSTSKGKTYTYLASKKDSSGRVWYQIQYTSNTKGWVMGQLAKLVETTATNPVTAYEGTYQCDRAFITIKASGKNDAKITVRWGSSAWEHSAWEMSGMFDPSVYRVDYGNGVRTDYVYNDNGSVSSKKVAYKNSTGRVQFKDTKTLVWRDENEQEHGEMTFTKISDTATEPEQPATTAKQVQITGSPVMVRSGAGTNHKKLGSTSKGKTYTYLASKKDSSGRVWYQIQYTSQTKGWVTSQFAKLVSTSTVDYSGEYVETIAGRATVTVTKKASGYDVWVRWPNSAAEVYNWNFTGTFNSNGVMNYTKCVKTIITFDENDNDSLKTSYTNGTGSLTIKNGTITWKDNKENAGEDVKFVKE